MERADKLARQIIGLEPVDRHTQRKVIVYDLKSVEKCVTEVIQNFCYLKRASNKHYQEPTRGAVRAWILKWVADGELESKVIPMPKGSGRMRKGKPTHRVVDPQRVRILFLSHKKYDLKVNQPGWEPAKFTSRSEQGRKRAGFFRKLIKKLIQILWK